MTSQLRHRRHPGVRPDVLQLQPLGLLLHQQLPDEAPRGLGAPLEDQLALGDVGSLLERHLRLHHRVQQHSEGPAR